MVIVLQAADDGIVIGSLPFWVGVAAVVSALIAVCAFAFSLYKHSISEARAQKAAIVSFSKDLEYRVEREVAVQVAKALTTNLSIQNEFEERSIRRHTAFADKLLDAEARLEAQTNKVASQSTDLARIPQTPPLEPSFESEKMQNEANEIAFEAQMQKILPPPIEPDPWIERLVEYHLQGGDLDSSDAKLAFELSDRHSDLVQQQEQVRADLRGYLEREALEGPSYYVHSDGNVYLIPSLSHRRMT